MITRGHYSHSKNHPPKKNMFHKLQKHCFFNLRELTIEKKSLRELSARSEKQHMREQIDDLPS